MEMCICGHVRYDHSVRGCGYLHRDTDGNWTVPCNKFEEATAQ